MLTKENTKELMDELTARYHKAAEAFVGDDKNPSGDIFTLGYMTGISAAINILGIQAGYSLAEMLEIIGSLDHQQSEGDDDGSDND